MLDTLKFILANRVLVLVYATTMLIVWCAVLLLMPKSDPNIDPSKIPLFATVVAFVVGGWAGLFVERKILPASVKLPPQQ